jgi:uncharacterized membrane protein HdeD (DUF308 family)
MDTATQQHSFSHEAAMSSVATYLQEMGADGEVARAKASALLREAREPYVRVEPPRSWWSLALRGLLAIAVGVVFLGRPVGSVVALVLVLGAWILVDGLITLVSAISERSWSMVPSGAIGMLVGYLILSRTSGAVFVFFILAAAWALARGAAEISMAARMQRHEPGRKSLVFLGAASFAFGILVLLSPILGLVTLGWWLGLYALIYGVVSLFRTFEVRHISNVIKDSWQGGAHAHPA